MGMQNACHLVRRYEEPAHSRSFNCNYAASPRTHPPTHHTRRDRSPSNPNSIELTHIDPYGCGPPVHMTWSVDRLGWTPAEITINYIHLKIARLYGKVKSGYASVVPPPHWMCGHCPPSGRGDGNRSCLPLEHWGTVEFAHPIFHRAASLWSFPMEPRLGLFIFNNFTGPWSPMFKPGAQYAKIRGPSCFRILDLGPTVFNF